MLHNIYIILYVIVDLKKKGLADEIRSDKGIANEVKPMIHTPASIFQENAESNTTRRSSPPNNSLAGSWLCGVMRGLYNYVVRVQLIMIIMMIFMIEIR